MKKAQKKPSSLIRDRQAKEKAHLLEHLEKIPIVEVACQKTGIGRTTFYRWRKADKKFARALSETLDRGTDRVNDMAESNVVKKVIEGDLAASKYWLGHKHPDYHSRSRPPPREDDQAYVIYLDR